MLITPFPLNVVPSVMIFYVFNGFFIGHYFGAIETYQKVCVTSKVFSLMDKSHLTLQHQDLLYTPRFMIGACLFFAGFAANIYCDHILINLRKPGGKYVMGGRGAL
jgi:hypothetical protein